MMNLLVGTPHFCGNIKIPPSKSHTLRALICAALADSSSYIESPLESEDIDTAFEILQSLGVRVQKLTSSTVWEITPPNGGLIRTLTAYAKNAHSTFQHSPITLHLGNSGTLLYFLGSVLAVSGCPVCFTGDASLQSRPVEPLLAIYRQAHISHIAASDLTVQAVLPLTFCGTLPAQTYTLSGPFSQPVSGLLFAAPLLHGTTRIFFKNPGEVPYLHITCNWLRKAGIRVQAAQNGSSFTITGIQPYAAFSEKIPGDWSSAAFPLAAAVVSNQKLILENLDIHDGQGDARIVSLLQKMGAPVYYDAVKKTLSVLPVPQDSLNRTCAAPKMPPTLTAISCNCSDIPDAVPVLAAVACFAQGQTRLTHAGVCRYKECDRLRAMSEELSLFGAEIHEGSDFLTIDGNGGHNLHPARVHSRHDHRVAMALAVTACGIAARTAAEKNNTADPCSCIENFECAAVSYPSFIEDLTAAGAAFSLEA